MRTLNYVVAASLCVVCCRVAPTAGADPGTSEYVRTQSGKVRCLVMTNNVGHGGGPAVICEASGPENTGFLQAPTTDYGSHWHNAVVDSAGNFNWADANIGGGGQPEDDVVLTYGRTLRVAGWIITPSSDGTTFTDDATGHGMFVSIEDVRAF
jgi:hypothetical protein